MIKPNLRVVVLISGSGSNLQALIDAQIPNLDLAAVISNEPHAFGLERAQRAGIATAVLSHRNYSDRASYDADLQRLIDQYAPNLVVLAGFMRILTATLVEHYRGRMLNIHPSLLPKFQGLHTHERALAAREQEHGASVHFVTAELDGGPVIAQVRVPVLPNDDADILAARVLAREHQLYPTVVQWFTEQRLALGADGRAWLDGAPLLHPQILM
ncbi:phosphoribosylglycinamide formyltransferase [Chromatium weissei]|nr:phosphoribosylglycinamide formyltransferase [Chromatium weissei]